MLLSREELRQDRYFDALTDAILERDQPRTADLFFGMVARDGRSVGDALSVATAAEAPFVQVPNHINVRDDRSRWSTTTTPSSACAPRRASHRSCPSCCGCCRICRASGTSRPGLISGTSCSASIPAATPP